MAGRNEDLTDSLAVLGNEIRMSILRELADADGVLSFTELRERVDIRDSGKFNYHLKKLCEYFVREADGGYELGHAGTRIIAVGDEDSEIATDGRCLCGEDECGKLFHVHLTPWST